MAVASLTELSNLVTPVSPSQTIIQEAMRYSLFELRDCRLARNPSTDIIEISGRDNQDVIRKVPILSATDALKHRTVEAIAEAICESIADIWEYE